VPISLNKGDNVSLSKENPGLTKVFVGLGWNLHATSGADYDLDADVFTLYEGDKMRLGAMAARNFGVNVG
jgi:tellurium resistance protein TerD